MTNIIFPKPLCDGSCIGLTSPSSGVTSPAHLKRLDLINDQWRARGYVVKEGETVRTQSKDASAPAELRARDFLQLWNDPSVDAIVPPWGGELLIEILPKLDFSELTNSKPKWILGFSDISTLLFALTVTTRIASAHGSNWMDLIDDQTFGVSATHERILRLAPGDSFSQKSFPFYQEVYTSFDQDFAAKFKAETPAKWKMLDGSAQCAMFGRVIGGCIDTLMHLVGTNYGQLPKFIEDYSEHGVILYLENCELSPVQLVRALWQMREAGWFEEISGLILGRSSGADAKDASSLSYLEVLKSALSGLVFPVIYDADIGHKPPQILLINGALASVVLNEDGAVIKQCLK